MADIDAQVTTPARKIEVETIMMITEITEMKNRVLEILSRYGVQKTDDLEAKIVAGQIPEHPSYEDYLSALSYEQGILALKKRLLNAIEEIDHI